MPPSSERPNRLTLEEFFSLFHRTGADTRWISSADSTEYLTLVTYLVLRNSQ